MALVARGARETDAGVEAIDDPDELQGLQAKSTGIHLMSLLNAAVVTVLFWAVATLL